MMAVLALDAAGDIFVSGRTDGSLGEPSAGYADLFLSKYDDAGNLLWTDQLGTSEHDSGLSVALDVEGNPLLCGETWGALDGPSAGRSDALLVKYDVPEPATLALLALGGLAVLRRRRM